MTTAAGYVSMIAALLLPIGSPGQSPPAGALGEFEGHGDVGKVSLAGDASFDPAREEYQLSGAGTNMWLDKDQLHLVWKRMKGDFILRARARFLGAGVEKHRKLGWIARSDLSTGSAHVNAVVHGDGLTSLQFRRKAGGPTEELKSGITGADVIQLERKGKLYAVSVARSGEPLSSLEVELDLGEELHVGLFVCSHNPAVVEKAVFDDVRIIVPAREGFVPYRDYIGSLLETVDVETGQCRVLLKSPDPIQAPNWTRDGKALIYNAKGRLARFDLETGKSAPIDTGTAVRNNNDHAISFDGRTLGISSHSAGDGGKSIVYTVPVEGGEPWRVTRDGPSYFHGWSPDGGSLLFTGERNGEFDVYRIAASGGEETRLTTVAGLDDGPEFTPDGRSIYFCSNRTGTMKVWRMKPDGGGQEQVTTDEYNDWFPHVSPDGKWIVFLSFSKEVSSSDHPFYRQVHLRRMPAEGGAPRVIAYVYGGQGTLNVPSWSPDGKRLAFVSNSTY